MNQIQNNDKNKILCINLIPNIITLLSLCAGLTAFRFALEMSWNKATIFIVIACFLDGIDGRLARFLNSESDFGAQLDSLIDFVNFGIIPPIVIYLWINEYCDIKYLDWFTTLLFAICMSIRLARFNSCSNESNFFFGIPAPCGAGLSLIPMMLSYEFGDDYISNLSILILIYLIIIAIAMVSKIPTISVKEFSIHEKYLYILSLLVAAIISLISIKLWLTLSIMGVIYLISIPITSLSYYKLHKLNQNKNAK